MPQAVFFGVAAEEERRPRERRVRRGSSSRGQIQGGDRHREGSAFLSRGNHNRFPEPRTVKNPQKTRPSSRHGPQNHPQESEKNQNFIGPSVLTIDFYDRPHPVENQSKSKDDQANPDFRMHRICSPVICSDGSGLPDVRPMHVHRAMPECGRLRRVAVLQSRR